MSDRPDFLWEEYTIETPENVSFDYEVAGIGSRFVGALVDSLIVGVMLALLNILLILGLSLTDPGSLLVGLLEEELSWLGALLLALYVLLNFTLFWGYFILFELQMNGQTPGKRIARTRVVRTDGNPAGAVEVVVRNLVRIVDFLPTAYALGLVVMFMNRETRRLGDFAAGTLVVRDRREIDLASLRLPVSQAQAGAAPSHAARPRPSAPDAAEIAALSQRYPHIDRLTAADYGLIQDALHSQRSQRLDEALLVRLAAAFARKLDAPPPQPQGSAAAARRMLVEIAALYQHLQAN